MGPSLLAHIKMIKPVFINKMIQWNHFYLQYQTKWSLNY